MFIDHGFFGIFLGLGKFFEKYHTQEIIWGIILRKFQHPLALAKGLGISPLQWRIGIFTLNQYESEGNHKHSPT